MSVQTEIDRIKNAVGLSYLAVNEMNGEIPKELSIDKLPDAIRSITNSGSRDPVEVYNETRPKDWYPMPIPNDDELYLLVNVPKDGSSLLAFSVTCTGNYTVTTYECTTLSELTEIETRVADSNTKFETVFLGSDLENGYLTSDGMHQVLVKITGMSIETWALSTHSKKSVPSDYISWNITEISGKLPNTTVVSCQNIYALRYFSLCGENSITNTDNMFQKCYSLTSIPTLDTSKVTSMNHMFYNCYSLTSIPTLDTSKLTSMNYMFYNCYSLTSIPTLDTSKLTSMNSTFNSCYSLTSIPTLDTSKLTSMNYTFYNCYSLTSIPTLDTSKLTSMNYTFNNCYSLTSIPTLDTSKVTSMNSTFYNCYSLTSIPTLDTSEVTSMNNTFNSCISLTSIPTLDTSKVTSMNNMFAGCYSLSTILILNTSSVVSMTNSFNYCDGLSAITLSPSIIDWAGVPIDLKQCSLLHDAIVALFESLPTITSVKTLTLTGNPGVSDLTDEDKLIATSKGWALTL